MNATMKRALCAFAACWLVSGAGAQANIDPKVRQVLDGMSTFYKQLNTATCSYTLDLTQNVNGKENGAQLDFTVSIERPNRVSFVQGKSVGGVDVVSDGKSLTISIPSKGKYTVQAPAESVGDALEWGALNAMMAFSSIFGELMGPDPAGAVLDGVSEAKYIGEDDVSGAVHHRIRLVQDDMDVDLWIATGDKPFLARMVPDFAKTVSDPGVKIGLILDFTNWSGNAPVPPERFAFAPRAGSTEAASIEEIFGAAQKHAALALIGKPAQAFSLKGPDGKPIDLQPYLGKNVVVLDFWATWCGPCTKSLPVIAEVTSSFKDQGVVFIAINQGETPDDVNAFLKQMDLSVTVALDTDRAVADQYLVSSIPQSVLIGKTGTVEAVHIGASPVLRPQLKGQLAALVAGRPLDREGG